MVLGLFSSGELLRIAPLLAATATLHYAWDEHYFLSIFLAKLLQGPQTPEATSKTRSDAIVSHPSINSIIPRYFTRFFNGTGGIVFLLGTNAVTIASAGLNLSRRSFSADSTRWYLYAAGLGFTVAHFWCVPLVMWHVKALQDMAGKPATEYEEDKPSKELRGWLKGHYIRSFLTESVVYSPPPPLPNGQDGQFTRPKDD
ncbi:hypothetical protein KEM56_005793, partial [Ascosphaera pollenicola]